jgi:Transposase and inactivated derivatives
MGAAMSCKNCIEKQLKIDDLEKRIEHLENQLQHQKRKEKEGVFGSSTPSSQIPLKSNSNEENQNKKGGAKPGHKGKGRRAIPENEADIIETCFTDNICPDCGGTMENKGWKDRGAIDGEPIKVKKVIHRCEKKWCPKCKKTFQAKPDLLPRSLYGNTLIANACVMHYVHGIPVGRLEEMFGRDISLGTLFKVFHRIAGIWKAAVEKLILEYRSQAVVHADETGWRTDGQSGYAWVFCTETISIFQFKTTRSAAVPKAVFGEERLEGVLVVDRYAGYNKMPIRIQYCYSHLLRAVQDLEKEFSNNREVMAFVETLAPLIADAIRLHREKIPDQEYYSIAEELKKRIIDTVERDARHFGIRKIQDIFRENEERLYQWVKDRRVPAENNMAERDLRPSVIARNVSFGSQSMAGAETRSILMSILNTARKRLYDCSVETWFKDCLDKISRNPSIDCFSLLPKRLS